MANTKPDFVRWTCNGVTAVMRCEDYEANQGVFRLTRSGAVELNLPFTKVPHIAAFSDRKELSPWVTGSLALLKRLLLWHRSVDRPIYVPFANGHEDLDEKEFFFLRHVERALKLSGDDFIEMFGLQLRSPQSEDTADCGPADSDSPWRAVDSMSGIVNQSRMDPSTGS